MIPAGVIIGRSFLKNWECSPSSRESNLLALLRHQEGQYRELHQESSVACCQAIRQQRRIKHAAVKKLGRRIMRTEQATVRVSRAQWWRSSCLVLSAMQYDSALRCAEIGTFFRSPRWVNGLAHQSCKLCFFRSLSGAYANELNLPWLMSSPVFSAGAT